MGKAVRVAVLLGNVIFLEWTWTVIFPDAVGAKKKYEIHSGCRNNASNTRNFVWTKNVKHDS